MEEQQQQQQLNRIITTLNERLESHDNSRKAAQDKLHGICEGLRKQIDDLENNINGEMEELFTKEDNRLQTILNILRNNTIADETPKIIQRAKAELLAIQSYEIFERNFNNNEPKIDFAEMYKLKTERKLVSLKLIDFEERKPVDITMSYTNKGNISISFAFFNSDEVKVLKSFNVPLKITFNLREKDTNEESAKTITKEYILRDQQILFCNLPFLSASTTYYLRMRIEHKDLTSEWSENAEFTTPEFNSLCVWKGCPGDGGDGGAVAAVVIEEKKKYFVDESNPKIATKIGSNGYCTVVGNVSFPPNKITLWNVKVLNSKKSDGCEMYVGVAPFDIDQNNFYNFSRCGWHLHCYDSTLWSGPPHECKGKECGPRRERGKYIHNGDIISVVMDTLKGELSFVLGGINLGVAYEGIPLDKPLVPCSLLYYICDSIEFVI